MSAQSSLESAQDLNPYQLIATAERVLSHTLGHAVQLTDLAILKNKNRNHVVRCRVLGSSDDGPSNVIIKQIKEKNEAGLNDRAGMEFLAQVSQSPQLWPGFLGGDDATSLFLMDDVASRGATLEDVLRGDDPALAEDWLVRTATGLGQLQVATVGQESIYAGLRSRLDRKIERARIRQAQQFLRLLPKVRLLLLKVGLQVEPRFVDEYEEVAATLRDPGPFLTYTHGDMAPSNVLLANDGPIFVDYEYGGFRHALYDAMFWRNICPFPQPVVERMEVAYRAALAEGCSAAEDDALFHPALVRICAHRLFWGLTWQLEKALEQDGVWADDLTTRMAYLGYLDSFVRLAESVDELPAMRDAAALIAVRLRAKWNIDEDARYDFPVFRDVSE